MTIFYSSGEDQSLVLMAIRFQMLLKRPTGQDVNYVPSVDDLPSIIKNSKTLMTWLSPWVQVLD